MSDLLVVDLLPYLDERGSGVARTLFIRRRIISRFLSLRAPRVRAAASKTFVERPLIWERDASPAPVIFARERPIFAHSAAFGGKEILA